MVESCPVVFLLDDQAPVVAALARLLRADGLTVRTWTSAVEFLDAHDGAIPGCLVTDVRMPRIDGLELQHALMARGVHRPIVFMTAEADIPTAVQAMKAGAVTFLSKPVDSVELLTAVREAFARDAASRSHEQELQCISGRLATLTPRERQVLDLIVLGLRNTQIASELGLAEKTVKAHRSHVMSKMKVARATGLVSLLSRAHPPASSVRPTSRS
jgi:FixJ family two-component response regulator